MSAEKLEEGARTHGRWLYLGTVSDRRREGVYEEPHALLYAEAHGTFSYRLTKPPLSWGEQGQMGDVVSLLKSRRL